MSIIFEGVDGIGKTTDIRRFMIFNPYYSYIHNWVKPKNRIDILSEATKEIFLLDSDTNNIVFDRSFIISEYVYAHVLGRDTPIDIGYVEEWVKLINRKCHTFKLFIFLSEEVLNIKPEDKKLPFKELNNIYGSLFNLFKPNNFILEER